MKFIDQKFIVISFRLEDLDLRVKRRVNEEH